jgi:hypothetical protein
LDLRREAAKALGVSQGWQHCYLKFEVLMTADGAKHMEGNVTIPFDLRAKQRDKFAVS